MRLFALEHSPTAYRADFALYGLAVVGLATALTLWAPRAQTGLWLLLGLSGFLGWSLAEYLLHRFVLHGVPPFRHWHAEHHRRPMALMGAPTVLSATLFVGGVFAPAWLISGLWPACALSCGMVTGYLAYAITHHATHHARSHNPWLLRRKRWHALHHAPQLTLHHAPGHFGVTSGFWDAVFRTAPRTTARQRAFDNAQTPARSPRKL
jgi:hypothetical protein